MRILFVQPHSLNPIISHAAHIYNFEPLGLYYLAATITANHDVELLDLNNELLLESEPNKDPLLDAMRTFRPDIVALSALTAVRTGAVRFIARRVKSISRRVVVVVGGLHAYLCPEDFEIPEIDYVLAVDAIVTFPRLVCDLEAGRPYLASQTHRASESGRNAGAQGLSLADWPLPCRQIGAKYRHLYRIAIGRPGCELHTQPIASVKSSSGCPHRCMFCCLCEAYPRYETAEVEATAAQIVGLDAEYVFLADDESLIRPQFVGALAEELIRYRSSKRLVAYGRVDTVNRNPELMERLAEAGLAEIWFGLEGASNEELNGYHKRNTTSDQVRAVTLCRRLGISVHATALVDPLAFGPSDFDRMLDHVAATLAIDSCHFFVLTPFKGTRFHRRVATEKPESFLTSDSDRFSIRETVLRPRHMSISAFQEAYARLQKEFNSRTIPCRVPECCPAGPLREELEETVRKNLALLHLVASAGGWKNDLM